MRRETDEKVSKETFDVKILSTENSKDFLYHYLYSQRIKNHENESPLSKGPIV